MDAVPQFRAMEMEDESQIRASRYAQGTERQVFCDCGGLAMEAEP